MKVLQLLDEPYDSGITASALGLASGLREDGVDVHVLRRHGSAAARYVETAGIPGYCFGAPWFYEFPAIARWAKRESFDIMHAHSGSMQTLAALLSRRSPCHLLRTRADARLPKRQSTFLSARAKSESLIFPSEILRQRYLAAFKYPIERAHVIRPCFEYPESSIHEGEAIKHGRLRIVILGRLDPVKGHEDFIRAAALVSPRHEQADFYMIGEEKNIQATALLNFAKKLNLGRRLQWLGFLEPIPLLAQMSLADVAVIASRGSEAVSRAALEWMRLGKPLVATSVGMLPELVVEGKTGHLVHPGSCEEMAYAIGRLLEDAQARERFGQEAAKRFSREFTTESAVAQHHRLYAQLLAAKARGRDPARSA
ncbi:MAG: glycosyltransferase family 4 protein [Elusimicrobiota bacterium]